MKGMICLVLASANFLVQAAVDRPNIILVMADDQGWGDMAYNGHPVLKTPNFDLAASSGLRFDRFYAAAPVCSPTRASVLTGRHPNRTGVLQWGYPLRPQETTLAEVLKTAGYVTGHFGKWHLGSVRNRSPAHPGANGFDHWVSAPNYFDNDPILSRKGRAFQARGESSMVTVDAAIHWIRIVADEPAPFLAVVWFGSPHGPHRATEEDRRLYPGQSKAHQNFLGEISGMDRAFGRLRYTLGDLGIRENTLLWYCSDNGALARVGSTGGHRGRKNTLYEGGLLVPAFLEWPARFPRPQVIGFRCSTSDIYPTLLEIAGVRIEHESILDGTSLVGLLDVKSPRRKGGMGFWNYPVKGIGTPSAQWMSELLEAQTTGEDLEPHVSSQHAAQLPVSLWPLDSFPGHSAWIQEDWKLHRIAADSGSVTWELYNLDEDPGEWENRVSSQKKRLQMMRVHLMSWLVSVAGSFNGQDYE